MSMGTKFIQNPPFDSKGRGTQQSGSYDSSRFTRFDRSDLSASGLSQSSQVADKSMTFARFGVGLASVLSEHVLSHPYIVIRRQSQVHHGSQWYHLTPFTLFHTIFNIQRHQSVTTLWKGIGSTLMVKGIGVATESAVSEFTPLPKEVSRHSPVRKLVEHLLLKGMSFIVVTPFYAASLVETVQSEIASERPGVFDCIKEGVTRIMTISSPPSTRLLPVWKLFFPTMLHGVMHYVISSLARYTVVLSMKSELISNKLQTSDSNLLENSQNQLPNAYNTFYPELVATFTGSLLADMMLYPLETILHRLCMQGTRTIIDNTDTGLGVIPIITRYEGVVDCMKAIISEEGISGLYKGFGALILQYGMHVLVLRLSKLVLDLLSNSENNRPILASELALRQQKQMEYEARLRQHGGSGSHTNTPYKTGDFLPRTQHAQHAGDFSSMSFNLDSSYATSTPYDTPQATSKMSYKQSPHGYHSHTGTGSAPPL